MFGGWGIAAALAIIRGATCFTDPLHNFRTVQHVSVVAIEAKSITILRTSYLSQHLLVYKFRIVVWSPVSYFNIWPYSFTRSFNKFTLEEIKESGPRMLQARIGVCYRNYVLNGWKSISLFVCSFRLANIVFSSNYERDRNSLNVFRL